MSESEYLGRPVNSLVIANQILWLRHEIDTTPMHVLKLVYICHGWMLGMHGSPLITEPVEAWTYGPVVPTVYHQYKKYGGGTILEETKATNRHKDLNATMNDLVQTVESVYRTCTAYQLSALTHQPNTPWDITRRKTGIGSAIPNNLIKKHYEDMLD